MRVLIISDLHLYPLNRIDNIFETVENKFEQIYQKAKEYNVERIWILGDIFNVYNPPLIWIYKFIELIEKSPCKIYALFGNHDFKGNKDNSALGLLIKTGYIQKLEDLEYKDKIVNVFEYTTDLKNLKVDINTFKEKDKQHIMLGHVAIFNSENEAIFDGLYADDFKDSGYKMVIVGHYHKSYIINKENQPVIISPGSVLRIKKNETHIPMMIILDLDKDINRDNLIIEEFKIKSIKEIFKLDVLENGRKNEDLQVLDFDFNSTNIIEELKLFLRKNIKKNERADELFLKYF